MKDISLLNIIKTKNAISKSTNIKFKDVKYVSSIFGGMSNKTYLFEASDKKYVVHISTKGYDLFLKRETELDALDKLKALDNIQKPVYLSEKLRIFEYIDGTSMNNLKYQDYYKEISECFHKLHDSNKLFKEDYKPFEFIEENIKLLNCELDELFVKSYGVLKENKDFLESRPVSPCHNDLQPSNLVLNDGKVYILDFEFAKNNDYLFDLASFGNLDFNDSLNIIKIYKPDYTEDELKALKLWRIAINCIWYLIAMKKKELGYDKPLKMDFREVALFFLNHNEDIIKSL